MASTNRKGKGRGKGEAKPPKKAKGRVERSDEEIDAFYRRIEWWQENFGDRTGCLDEGARLAALDAAERYRPPNPHDLDPGGDAPRRRYQLEGGKGTRVVKAKNPAPRSSLGFVGNAMQVTGKDLTGAVLKVALPEDDDSVDLGTVRVFRYDDKLGEWSMIQRSGVDGEGRYAWAHLRQPGTYALVGLPSDAWLMTTIMAIDAYQPWLNAARELDRLPDAIDRICRLILCDGMFGEVINDPELGRRLDLPPMDGERFENVCERCIGLDPMPGGLPELQIVPELEEFGKFVLDWWPWPKPCSTWTSQGPRNVNGRIKSLAIHPSNGSIIYAGAADGGVWKSTNGGASWYSTMSLELSMAIGALAIAPSATNTIYAATGEYTPGWGPSYPGVGVYKSTDAGSDWDLVGPIPSTRCTAAMVHPTDPNRVYVAGNLGFHESTDGGATWTTLRTGAMSDAMLDPTAPEVLYVGQWNSGVYKSTDAGATWDLLSNGIPTGSSAEWIKLAMGRDGAGGTNFLLAKMGTDSGEIYKSTDGGASWAKLAGTHNPASYNEWTNMIGVDPSDHDIIHSGGIGYKRSTDGGGSFNSVGGTHSDHHQVVFDPAHSSTVYMATDGGVYRSTDAGASWDLRSTNLVATQLYSIGVSQTSPLLIGSGTQDQGIIRSDGSQDWANTGAGNEGGFFVVDPNDSSNAYCTPWSTNLRRSTDGAVTWTTILSGLATPPDGAPTVRHLAVRPGNSNHLLCVADSSIFRSTDQGASWSTVAAVVGTARQVAYAPSNGSIAFAATSSGRVYRNSNGGAGAWAEPYAAGDGPPAGSINSLAVHWTDPDYVAIGYAGNSGPKLFISEDGGQHWSDAGGALASDALPSLAVTSVVFHPYHRETFYAANPIGVFRTRDGGDSWDPFEDGMPRIVTTQLALRKSTRTLYASTMGRGAYRRTV